MKRHWRWLQALLIISAIGLAFLTGYALYPFRVSLDTKRISWGDLLQSGVCLFWCIVLLIAAVKIEKHQKQA